MAGEEGGRKEYIYREREKGKGRRKRERDKNRIIRREGGKREINASAIDILALARRVLFLTLVLIVLSESGLFILYSECLHKDKTKNKQKKKL